MTVIIDYAPTSASPSPFFLPRLPTSASSPRLSLSLPTLPVPLERGHLLNSLRFLLCGCVYASWSTRWFRNNPPTGGWRFDRIWEIEVDEVYIFAILGSFFFFFCIVDDSVEFLKSFRKGERIRVSKEIEGDLSSSVHDFQCWTIIASKLSIEIIWKIDVSESSCMYSWRTHALSRARGCIRPDYAEGGPIDVRRPLFVRTRSLRSVANFSREVPRLPFEIHRLPDISMVSACWFGRAPIRVDARGRLRRFSRWTADIRDGIRSHWSSMRDGIRCRLSGIINEIKNRYIELESRIKGIG